jgi:hypothetical protein
MPAEGMAARQARSGARRLVSVGLLFRALASRYLCDVTEPDPDLASDLRRCADLVRAALPKRPKSVGAPLARALEVVAAIEVGEDRRAHADLAGLDEELADLAQVGGRRRSVVAAVEALVLCVRSYAEGEPLDRHRVGACIAMALAPPPPPPTIESVRARLEALAPGDDAELTALFELACEHRMRALAPALLDRLELDDSTLVPSHAVRLLQRLFAPDLEAFVALCAERLDAERAATRRWAARGLSTSVRPEHVPLLIPLLDDREPLVRREAATALRAAHAWHAESRDAIRAAAVAASGASPGDRALAELLAASRDP